MQYKQYTYSSTKTNSINHLAIDVDETTEVQLGMPANVNGRESTVANANRNSREGIALLVLLMQVSSICLQVSHYFY